MANDLRDSDLKPAFRLDGKTVEDFMSEPLPTSVTVPLTPLTAAVLASRAFYKDRPIEYVAAQLLHEIVEREHSKNVALAEALANPERRHSANEGSELAYRRRVISMLRAAGIVAEAEVQTESGCADVVVYQSEKPHTVIELKKGFGGRRAVLQASGQAAGYAKALRAKHYVLSAPEVPPELLKPSPGAARVIAADQLVAEIQRLLGDGHVVNIAERR